MAEMRINGRDIKTFHARLLDYSVGGTAVNNNTSAVYGRLAMPLLFGAELSPRPLSVTLTFFPHGHGTDSRGKTLKEKYARATENITAFESLIFGNTVEISLPDGFIYTALISSVSAPGFDGSGLHDVTYQFSAIRHKARETLSVLPNGKIFCKSNTKTPFKLSLAVPRHYSLITVCGIAIRGVSANEEIVIDSENGLVTANGKNKFSDTNLTDFPYLSPGCNTISCFADDAVIKVTYTPIFA